MIKLKNLQSENPGMKISQKELKTIRSQKCISKKQEEGNNIKNLRLMQLWNAKSNL